MFQEADFVRTLESEGLKVERIDEGVPVSGLEPSRVGVVFAVTGKRLYRISRDPGGILSALQFENDGGDSDVFAPGANTTENWRWIAQRIIASEFS
jgi:hypothetical protein